MITIIWFILRYIQWIGVAMIFHSQKYLKGFLYRVENFAYVAIFPYSYCHSWSYWFHEPLSCFMNCLDSSWIELLHVWTSTETCWQRSALASHQPLLLNSMQLLIALRGRLSLFAPPHIFKAKNPGAGPWGIRIHPHIFWFMHREASCASAAMSSHNAPQITPIAQRSTRAWRSLRRKIATVGSSQRTAMAGASSDFASVLLVNLVLSWRDGKGYLPDPV
jgi:hypothetical protein